MVYLRTWVDISQCRHWRPPVGVRKGGDLPVGWPGQAGSLPARVQTHGLGIGVRTNASSVTEASCRHARPECSPMLP